MIRITRERDDLYSLQWALLESVYPALGGGRLEQAMARAEEALALNRKLGDRGDEPLFLDAYSWVQRNRGRYGPALEAARRATAAAEFALPEWQAWTAATLGWLLLDLRAAEEAVPLLERGLAAAEEAEAAGELLRCDALRAWALCLRGRSRDAMLAAESAEERLRKVTTPSHGSWLFGAHAQLALARTLTEAGELGRARRIATSLRTAASEVGWLEVEAGAAVALAHCAVADDRPDEATRLLTGAARVPGASAVAWEARLGLAELEVDDGERHRTEARDLLERVRGEIDGDPAAVEFQVAYKRSMTGGASSARAW